MAGKYLSDAHELAQRNRELAILNEIAAALNQEVDLSAALNTTLRKVADLLHLRTGWIWLLQEGSDEYSYLAAAQNLPPALRDNPQRMEGSCHCLNTFRAGDLGGAANINVVTCTRLWGLVDGTDGLRYHTSVPLYASHGKKLGVLNVADTDWREPSEDDLQLLHIIGDLLSITIERARLFDQSRQIGASEERVRLAREIHDTLGQSLTAITLQMETADALLESGTDPENVWPIIRKALELSRSGLQEARRSVLDLRAVPLEGRTLFEALGELVSQFRLRTGLSADYHAVGEHSPVPPRLEIAMFRIAQEALANVERHASAGKVRVELAATPDNLRLTVTDDGLGFRLDDIPAGHYGLAGINERVHLMGGRFELQSSPGAGTRLRVSIPFQSEES
jgi:two-component system NarL family sensor kinase